MSDHPPYITIDVEHFLSSMLGKNSTHGLSGGDETAWVKEARRLVRHLRHYVLLNAQTSKDHLSQMLLCVEKMEKSFENPRTREPELVSAVVDLCVLLLGMRPDHWNLRAVNHSKHFRLDRYRSLTYGQTPEQRAALLYDRATKWAPSLSDDEKREVASKFGTASTRDDYIRFCQWMEDTHPDEYVEWTSG